MLYFRLNSTENSMEKRSIREMTEGSQFDTVLES